MTVRERNDGPSSMEITLSNQLAHILDRLVKMSPYAGRNYALLSSGARARFNELVMCGQGELAMSVFKVHGNDEIQKRLGIKI